MHTNSRKRKTCLNIPIPNSTKTFSTYMYRSTDTNLIMQVFPLQMRVFIVLANCVLNAVTDGTTRSWIKNCSVASINHLWLWKRSNNNESCLHDAPVCVCGCVCERVKCGPLTCMVSVILCRASFASGLVSSSDRALLYKPSAVTSFSCSSSLEHVQAAAIKSDTVVVVGQKK